MIFARFPGYDLNVLSTTLATNGFGITSRPGEPAVFRSSDGRVVDTYDSPGGNAGYFSASAPDVTVRFHPGVDDKTVEDVRAAIARFREDRR